MTLARVSITGITLDFLVLTVTVKVMVTVISFAKKNSFLFSSFFMVFCLLLVLLSEHFKRFSGFQKAVFLVHVRLPSELSRLNITFITFILPNLASIQVVLKEYFGPGICLQIYFPAYLLLSSESFFKENKWIISCLIRCLNFFLISKG